MNARTSEGLQTETTPEGPGRHAYSVHNYHDGAGALVMRKVLVDGLRTPGRAATRTAAIPTSSDPRPAG